MEEKRGHSAFPLSSAAAEDLCDSDLLCRLQAGDERAFEALVLEQGGRMLSVAKRFFSNEQDAADAVQDAFLSAFKAIGSFKGEAKIGTWLYRILVNACLMRRRLQDRQPTEAIEALLPQFDNTGHHAARVPRFSVSPSDALVNKELRQHVRACIDALPADYREILILRDIEEIDTQSTARNAERVDRGREDAIASGPAGTASAVDVGSAWQVVARASHARTV